MDSTIASKIVGAVAGVLTGEWIGNLLDRAGLSDEDAHLAREVVKAAASALAGIVVAAVLDGILGSESARA